jgi:hypothetical protein
LYYSIRDKNGNNVFSIEDSVFEKPIFIITATDYDSLGRLTKMYSAHSQIGFNIDVIDYQNDKRFAYKLESGIIYPFDRETFNSIKTREEFVSMEQFKNLENGIKFYGEFFEDTISKNYKKYKDSNGRYYYWCEDKDFDSWTRDTNYINSYPKNVKINRHIVTYSDNVKMSNFLLAKFIYNENNKLICQEDYDKNVLKNKTDYFYNKENELVSMIIHNYTESRKISTTIHKYNNKGEIRKTTQIDQKGNKKVINL